MLSSAIGTQQLKKKMEQPNLDDLVVKAIKCEKCGCATYKERQVLVSIKNVMDLGVPPQKQFVPVPICAKCHTVAKMMTETDLYKKLEKELGENLGIPLKED